MLLRADTAILSLIIRLRLVKLVLRHKLLPVKEMRCFMLLIVVITIWILLSVTFLLFACVFSSRLSQQEEIPVSERQVQLPPHTTPSKWDKSSAPSHV